MLIVYAKAKGNKTIFKGELTSRLYRIELVPFYIASAIRQKS
jgi:hypothetical protein